ncbi:DUF4866 domain-containing protein [uncultured Eubacterium sp.]|uniref:DUF4866 domain-containing protein n=1 Tax=uncultured Eubacterium sp. TaxID=165185 RepID=UPI003264C5CA
MTDTISKIPREEAVEAIFSKIVKSSAACERLSETFYEHLSEDELIIDSNPERFAKILFSAYESQDISALLLEICQKSMFDLLRESYLIPKRFYGKEGKNPVLLTDVDGNLLDNIKEKVSHHEYSKFREVYDRHICAPRSKIYLADGFDIVRSYNEELKIEEKLDNKRRGVMVLYALPDTVKLGMTEAQAYAIIWDAFRLIQRCAPSAMVYYGQETGEKNARKYDEIGILLPIHEFEKKMLQHLEEIDGIVLSCREEMMKNAGENSLEL